MSNEFEQRLNMVMGASKDIILADDQIAKTSTMDRIFSVLENIQRDRAAFSNANYVNGCPEMVTSLNSQWPYSPPSVSPVKVAKNKKLSTLAASGDNTGASNLSLNLLELERSKSARLRQQLESSLSRERQLRQQVEHLLTELSKK